jgi:hypothetical protein
MKRQRFRKKMHLFRNRRPDTLRYSTVHLSRTRFECQCSYMRLSMLRRRMRRARYKGAGLMASKTRATLGE